jgi:hypothetical protein
VAAGECCPSASFFGGFVFGPPKFPLSVVPLADIVRGGRCSMRSRRGEGLQVRGTEGCQAVSSLWLFRSAYYHQAIFLGLHPFRSPPIASFRSRVQLNSYNILMSASWCLTIVKD